MTLGPPPLQSNPQAALAFLKKKILSLRDYKKSPRNNFNFSTRNILYILLNTFSCYIESSISICEPTNFTSGWTETDLCAIIKVKSENSLICSFSAVHMHFSFWFELTFVNLFLPVIVYPLPTNIKALMGGWWLICSPYTGHPFTQAWNVSPRMGLNGFYIIK